MSKKQKPLIFSTSRYDPLRRAMEETDLFQHGKVERKKFKDGERYHRLTSDVEGRKVVLVGGTIDDSETMELFDMGNAIHDNGAKRLKIVVPYFGYSTMERAVKAGEAVKAKYRARLLSAIPSASSANRFYFVDLHSEGIPHYLEGGVQAKHIYAKSIVMEAARELARKHAADRVVVASPELEVDSGTVLDAASFILASTDAGRMKWVESLAKEMGVAPAFAYKRRVGDDATESLGIGGSSVKGAFVIIYDDMIRTGGSAMKAAQAYIDAGADAVAMICTHGLFPGQALAGLQESGLFTNIVCTDTHPRYRQLNGDGFLIVKSVADLLARSVFNGQKR